jgi:hypothetical protein
LLHCFRRNVADQPVARGLPITAADRRPPRGPSSSITSSRGFILFHLAHRDFMSSAQTSKSKPQQPNPARNTTVPSSAPPKHSRESLFGPLLAVSIALVAIVFGPSVLRRLPAFTPLLRTPPPASRTVFTPPQWTMPGKNDDNDPRWNGCVGVELGGVFVHPERADERGVM